MELIAQIIRFGAVGAIAFVIDYSILYIMTEYVGLYYLISSAISFAISMIFNYSISMSWVFKSKKNANKIVEFTIFLILSIIGLGINQLTMFILVEYYCIYYMISKIFATSLVMVWNFITRKIFIEEQKQN